ncbi:inositol 1,3,4-trisphosphate 5/6-kinase 4 isoform X2 [Tasmannia lanceolata]|uniref:inositol 1,3,4-trisphosphate 5/6-kinase 4 isoform X2 n=1 Tax=Tasmannia lanceolata TaxID=3420 RepID=UPI0040628870
MAAVGGVLLDESILFAQDGEGNTHFVPGSEALLRRLHYSKIHTGISYGDGVSSQKVTFIKKMSTLYSLDCIALDASCIDAFNGTLLAWSGAGESYFYVTSKIDKDLILKLSNQGWTIVVKSSKDSPLENTRVQFINKLEELPINLCRCTKLALHDTKVVTIGYIMKSSREEDFAKRGAFPMYPTQNGLIFVPLTFDLPLAPQLQEVDAVLHKATDEIVRIDPANFLDCSEGVSFSKGIQELERYIQDHPDYCIIDPLNNIYPLLDRLSIQQILLKLEDINTESRCKIRAPHFLKVDNFHMPNMAERLSEAKLIFPNIVKPQVACGVADAHNMAIVFRTEDFRDLSVPLPAIVQEYIDHSSHIFKFYVLGEKVFHAVRKSTPNTDVLLSSSEKNGSRPIIFDR